MVENNLTTNIREDALAQMRATDGYKILEKAMRDKYTAAAASLVTDSDCEDIEKIIVNRARCRLLREIFREAGVRKEDTAWTHLLT